MKVSKPPSGSLLGRSVDLPAVKKTGAKGFADKLARASGADKASAATATQPAARAGKVSAVADIGKALRAGQVTPQAALDRVIERIVARQVGVHGPAALKKNLTAALRQTLEDDPMLAAKIRALGDE
jgi:outer membrane translocation and assembly module TamA